MSSLDPRFTSYKLILKKLSTVQIWGIFGMIYAGRTCSIEIELFSVKFILTVLCQTQKFRYRNTNIKLKVGLHLGVSVLCYYLDALA